MNYAEICIIKRDGKREDFSISKIKNAISKAFSASGIQDEQQLVADITMNVISQFATPTITVEERCQFEQRQHEQSHACRADDDVRFRSN